MKSEKLKAAALALGRLAATLAMTLLLYILFHPMRLPMYFMGQIRCWHTA